MMWFCSLYIRVMGCYIVVTWVAVRLDSMLIRCHIFRSTGQRFTLGRSVWIVAAEPRRGENGGKASQTNHSQSSAEWTWLLSSDAQQLDFTSLDYNKVGYQLPLLTSQVPHLVEWILNVRANIGSASLWVNAWLSNNVQYSLLIERPC